MEDPLAELRTWLTALVRAEVRSALGGNTGDLLSTAEAAQFMKIAPGTLRRWVAQGRLEPQRAGRELRFRRADLEALAAPRARARRPASRLESPEEIGARLGWSKRT